jgi:hypothetical protein
MSARWALGAITGLAIACRLARSGSPNLDSNREQIQHWLDNMPPKWRRELEAARKEQRSLGLPVTPKRPTVSQVIDTVLEITAGDRAPGSSKKAGPRGPKDVPVSAQIRDAAMDGLKLSFEHDYPAWKFIGLARGMQLATQEKIWRRSQRRARNYLRRHQRDKQGKDWGNIENPSKGWMAYLIWGGEPAWEAWRKK